MSASVRLVLVLLLAGPLGLGTLMPEQRVGATVAATLGPASRDRAIAAAVQVAIRVRLSYGTSEVIDNFPFGSGTVVSPDGLILTNQHVTDREAQRTLLTDFERELQGTYPAAQVTLDDSSFTILTSDGVHPPEPSFTATVAQSDDGLDLAVLQITGDEDGRPFDRSSLNLSHLPLGDSDALRLGDPVHLFAFPAIGGDALTYTEGVVSGFRFEDGIDGTAWIKTDAVMSGGSSGGSAVDQNGLLIGVPTQGSDLDCRPGDTNRDGTVDEQDVGCIPTGGSIGELRPVNLAKPLLARVGFASDVVSIQPSPTREVAQAPTPTSTTRVTRNRAESLDLPALTLVPDDIDQIALAGNPSLFIDSGGVLDATGAAVWFSGEPAVASSLRYSLQNADVRHFYRSLLRPSSADGTASESGARIESYVADFWSGTGAEQAYRALVGTKNPRELSGGIAGPSKAAMSRSTGYDSDLGKPAVTLDLVFTEGSIVAGVRYQGAIDDEPSEKQFRELARILYARLSGATPSAALPLSATVPHDLGDGFDVWFDAYLMRSGKVALIEFRTEDDRRSVEAAWRSAGITDRYTVAGQYPVGSAASLLVAASAVAFESTQDASSWLSGGSLGDIEAGATNIRTEANVLPISNPNLLISYETPKDMGVPYVREMLVQDGDRVALFRVRGPRPVDDRVMLDLGNGVATCLWNDCWNSSFPALSSLEAYAASTSGSTIVNTSPTPTPRPTSTPRPAPSPTPKPTATSIAQRPGFGFTEPFDDVSPTNESNNDNYRVTGVNGQLVFTVKRGNVSRTLGFADSSTGQRDFGFLAEIASFSGQGSVIVELASEQDSTRWAFAVDPGAKRWALFRATADGANLFSWIDPRDFRTLVGEQVIVIAVEVEAGVPRLLVNSVDVTTPTGLEMPRIQGSQIVGFGAGDDLANAGDQSAPFIVAFDSVTLYELP